MPEMTIQQAFDLAIEHHKAGQFYEAESLYRQILAAEPRHASSLHHLGLMAHQVGRKQIAVDMIRQAIALQPDSPDAAAHSNLGNALRDMGQQEEAIAAYRQAIAIQPHLAEIYNNLATALCDTGQLDAAIVAFRDALALKPTCVGTHSNLITTLHFHPDFDTLAIAGELRTWNQRHAEPLRSFIRPHINDRTPERRLRIGYVSPDFRGHVVGYNMLPLLTHHNSEDLEIFCYAGVANPDALTQRFRACVSHWRNTMGLTDERLTAQIREDKVDILVDLTLHLENHRLLVFARKPAPVQVTFAGYPGSTGLPAIDYRLSDPYLDPPGMDESVYSEQTVRLPNSFWCYDPFDVRDIPVCTLPAESNGFVTFGCLNNLGKVNASVVRLWASVMRAVPSSRLLLLAPEGSHRRDILELLHQEYIDAQRIEFVAKQPRRKYLELYHRIDLGLDTLPYNGHTTSLDSLWMGVPVVTLVGQTIVGRAGLSQSMNLGIPEMVAQTPVDFVSIAAELAADLPRLAQLRSTLRPRMEKSPLMDAQGFARDIETAYRDMWRKWCDPPNSQLMTPDPCL